MIAFAWSWLNPPGPAPISGKAMNRKPLVRIYVAQIAARHVMRDGLQCAFMYRNSFSGDLFPLYELGQARQN
jgi:hypothetical protein